MDPTTVCCPNEHCHARGQTGQDAARIALRLPAFCGLPTREEAEQVLQVSVARQQEMTGHGIS